MFHNDIHPRNILEALMSDSMQTLERLLDAGFPLNAVPPHHTSVYASLVDDEVEAALEDPGGGKEARPGGYLALECFGLCWHKKSWVSTDLTQV